jgi:hypothetical protein
VTPHLLRTAKGRLDTQSLRAAWWALRVLLRVRSELKNRAVEEVKIAAPPELAPHALRGVEAVLRRRPHSCLERSLVLQRWYAGHGRPLDVVIGVTAPTSGFRAHAWLDGDPASEGFDELMRLGP